MKSKIRSLISKQDFQPGIIGLFVNPFYFARRSLYNNIKMLSDRITGKVLDVGCGRKPYRSLFKECSEYIGMDIEQSGHDHSQEQIDVYYDGKTFPFPAEQFDSVICIQVLEHVLTPIDFIREINRVLKKNGLFILTVPFIWDEHEQPYDYFRYTSFGIRQIIEQNGFEVLEQRKSLNNIRTIFQLFNAYMFKKSMGIRRISIIHWVITFLLFMPSNLIGQILYYITPKNNDLYLDNILLLKKSNNVE